MAGLTVKLTQDRLKGEKAQILIHAQGDLIETGLAKWPKDAVCESLGETARLRGSDRTGRPDFEMSS